MNRAYEQKKIVAFLSSSAAYGSTAVSHKVECLETRYSYVFLVGPRAFKLKKDLATSVFDHSTVESRHMACMRELAQSRPMAPTLYRGLMRVTQEANGALVLGGGGHVVDWLIAMNRFEQSALFDRQYKSDSTDYDSMIGLAGLVARFHATAGRTSEHGGLDSLRRDIARLRTDMLDEPEGTASSDQWAALLPKLSETLERNASLIEERRQSGFVRHGHGALHLGNICFYEDQPTPFSALGLADEWTHHDVLHDSALLLADMNARGLMHQANCFFNHYLDAGGDHDGLPLLPLFLSLRAAQHARTLAQMSVASSSGKKTLSLRQRATGLVEDARRYLLPTPPCLVVIGGFFGCGKSHLAREIAPFLGNGPGARILRTDVVRKKILGIDLDDELDADGYTPAMSERAYGGLYRIVAKVLQSGCSVVVDAVCAAPEQRLAFEAIARQENVPFQGFWLKTSPEVLRKRINKRKEVASDAAAVLRLQFSRDIGPMDWPVIDTSLPKEETIKQTYTLLRESIPSSCSFS